MPDQSSAAREHALIQQITAPLDSLPEDPVQFTADVEFPVVLRGYDRIAVDAYVRRTSQMVAELQARTSPQAAIRRALERVGEEVSGILQRAHETAGEITAQSRREAEDRLELARAEAQRITAEAERRVSELDADADRIWEERERIVADVRDLSRQLGELADAAATRFAAPIEAAGAEEADEPAAATAQTEDTVAAGDGARVPADGPADDEAQPTVAMGFDQEAFSAPEADSFTGSEDEPRPQSGTDPLAPESDTEPFTQTAQEGGDWAEEPEDAPTVAIEPLGDGEQADELAGADWDAPGEGEPGSVAADDERGPAPEGPRAARAPFDFEADAGALPGVDASGGPPGESRAEHDPHSVLLDGGDPPGESITARQNLGLPRL